MWVGDGAALLAVYVETGFVLSRPGRFVHEAAPDRSPGPRFGLKGCAQGNVPLVRDDVDDDVADELLRLAADEPPLFDPEAVPVHLAEYLEVLSVAGTTPPYDLGLHWAFPGPCAGDSGMPVVRSGTETAEEILRGMPATFAPGLVASGFRGPADVWAPWVAAVDDGRVVAIAETVRRGPGAEVGVDTADTHRGRGIGAAVTAAWSRHHDLRGLDLFYGTSRTNTSSRRLVERLGLTFLGSSMEIE